MSPKSKLEAALPPPGPLSRPSSVPTFPSSRVLLYFIFVSQPPPLRWSDSRYLGVGRVRASVKPRAWPVST